MDVTLVYLDGCPNWRTVDHRLRRLAEEMGVTITHRVITSPEDARGTVRRFANDPDRRS
jgi:hypothetical protein